MSRIRSIHPSIYTDEAFMALTVERPLAIPLLLGLWCEADDAGVFEWKPLTIKARILPAVSVAVEELLCALVEHDFIKLYDVEGKPYGVVRNFAKFQRPKSPKIVHPLPDDLKSYSGMDETEEDREQGLRRRKHAEQDGKCAYCRAEITYYSKRFDSLEIDHVLPICRGGTDDDENLVASCRTCNRQKGKMTGDEFRAWLIARVGDAKFPRGNAKSATTSAKGEIARQMEDGGGRMEEKEEVIASAPRKASRAKARTKISEDAQPTDKDKQAAKESGMTDEVFRGEWSKFRNHHIAKGSTMANWEAAWRTWCANYITFQTRNVLPFGPAGDTRSLRERGLAW